MSNNQKWSEQLRKTEPDFFEKLAGQQAAKYLWIGCSDSRVPANDIVGLQPGELFVHRNVANLVYPSDLNCLSVVEYAVNVLKVRHIIVVGHYRCGGVKVAMENTSHGLIDNWLAKIKDVYVRYQKDIDSLLTPEMQLDRMCELNVIEQMRALSYTPIVQDAWTRNQELSIHGWIYGLKNGRGECDAPANRRAGASGGSLPLLTQVGCERSGKSSIILERTGIRSGPK